MPFSHLRGLLLPLLLLFGVTAFPNHCKCLTMSSSVGTEAEEKAQSVFKVWESRRKISRFVFQPVARGLQKDAEKIALEPMSLRDQPGREDSSSSLVSGAFIAAGTVLLVRLGGRGLLVNLLGLDMIANSSAAQSAADFINRFQEYPDSVQLLSFFLCWLFVKALCIDSLTVLLALSSGLLFHDSLFEGTVASVACSSTASLLIFTAFRAYARDRFQQDIARRPALKAIDRACSSNGFKTVLTLRLSPLLPIPIAAYNYLYAVLSVTPFEFFAGITLGSIKPYLLDCYLGLFGKSFLLSSTDTPDSGGELVLLGVVALVVIVGSFAAQVAARSWEEIQQEINMLQQTLRARDDPSDLTRYGGDLNDVGLWDLIGVKDEELPQFLRGWKQTFDRAYTRLEIVLFDEWSKIWNDLCENEKNLQSQTVLRAGVSANMVLPPKYEMSSEASEDSNERAKFFGFERLIAENDETPDSYSLTDLTLESFLLPVALLATCSKMIGKTQKSFRATDSS